MTRQEVFSSYLSRYRHAILHHPKVEGQPVAADPYLSFPFTYEGLLEAACQDRTGSFNRRRVYDISEGFYYSRAEKSIHGYDVHGGIDIAVPYGTTVVAPCSGYAMSSYHSFPIQKEGQPRYYQGKPIYFGLGYFVQLYNPDVDRYVVLGHLSTIAEKIPFSRPTYGANSDSWSPTNHTVKIVDMPNHDALVPVVQGAPLGAVGFSGLRWGYEEYRESSERPTPLNTQIFKSYDEPHLHLDEYRRDQETGVKGLTRDPYDIYMRSRRCYPTPTRIRPLGIEPLWFLGYNELPKYAR